MNLEEFIAKQLELLSVERDAEIEENRCLHENSSVKDLQRKGVCIPKLRLANSHTGLFGRHINKFESFWPGKFPSHNIRSGDIVGIGQLTSDGKRDITASGVVTHVKDENISVALEKDSEDSVLESDMQYFLLKLANDVTYKRLKNALKCLNKERSERSTQLIEVLFGHAEPRTGLPIAGDIVLFNQNLNETQIEAVKFALSQKEVSLIHGPPGTGKTTTVAEIILQAVSQKLKILACAPSNVAVDNLVEKLSVFKTKMIRLGHPARFLPGIQNYSLDAVISKSDGSRVIEDLQKEIDKIKAQMGKTKESAARRSLWSENKLNLKELRNREKTVISEVLKLADVVLCTLTSATSDGPIKHLPKEHFDVVIIDECSQALEASCWIALLHGPRCVLAGDHHQLPPTIISEKAAKDGLEETLMERLIKLHGNSIVKMLNIQYRMHKKIMEWPSNQLYEGKLNAHTSVSSHLLRDIPGVEDDENTSIPLLLIDTTGCDLDELDIEDEESKGNEGEADLVSCHVENLVKSGVDASDIAVITPYNLQVGLIKFRLSAKYPRLEIKSVDGFQGREKEAVVLSLVRSNTQGEVGFLSEDRRINVAITRAKRHLAVICNSETVSHHLFLKSFVDYVTSEGEVRSAFQYEKEIGIYGKYQFRNSESDKSTPADNISKKKEKTLSSKDKRKDHKSNTGLKAFSKQEKQDVKGSVYTPEYKAEKLVEYQTILMQFAEDDKTCMLKFSPELNAFERRIVHEVSEKLGLLHISQGDGVERYIEVKKPETSKKMQEEYIEVKKPETAKKLQEEYSGKQAACSDSDFTGSKSKASTDENLESENMCSFCGVNVPINNMELHVINCKKLAVAKEKKRKPNKKTTLNKNEVPSNSNEILDADFDALINETMKANRTCGQHKCKKNISTLGQQCQYCRLRFCFSHFTPEIHGCGAEAKIHARRQIKRDGKLYPGSGKPQKGSDAVRHAQLQHVLNKKLSNLSSQRKPKPKE